MMWRVREPIMEEQQRRSMVVMEVWVHRGAIRANGIVRVVRVISPAGASEAVHRAKGVHRGAIGGP